MFEFAFVYAIFLFRLRSVQFAMFLERMLCIVFVNSRWWIVIRKSKLVWRLCFCVVMFALLTGTAFASKIFGRICTRTLFGGVENKCLEGFVFCYFLSIYSLFFNWNYAFRAKLAVMDWLRSTHLSSEIFFSS